MSRRSIWKTSGKQGKKITDFKRIIGFRNILIHGYSIVKHDIVWSVVEHRLPTLLAEVSALLAEPPRG